MRQGNPRRTRDGLGVMERKKGKLEMKPKSRKFSRRFLLHPQSLAAEAPRSSRDFPRISDRRLFKAPTNMLSYIS